MLKKLRKEVLRRLRMIGPSINPVQKLDFEVEGKMGMSEKKGLR